MPGQILQNLLTYIAKINARAHLILFPSFSIENELFKDDEEKGNLEKLVRLHPSLNYRADISKNRIRI